MRASSNGTSSCFVNVTWEEIIGLKIDIVESHCFDILDFKSLKTHVVNQRFLVDLIMKTEKSIGKTY